MRSGKREGIGPLRTGQYTALVCSIVLGCSGDRVGTGGDESAAPTTVAAVLPGIDVLIRDSLHLVRDRRVGLITNHTGLTAAGTTSIDALHAAAGTRLVALFSPEHGIRGTTEGGASIEGGIDAATGLPIHSLYGDTRKPTAEMLAEIDVLLFDIQDIGARYYTYVSTMALAMQAAGERGIPFVVLDRPDPIGGAAVNGNVLDPAFASFVGMYPVPMRHGMTPGELARLIRGEFGVVVDLTVVPVAGWQRTWWFDETGLPWVAPSPNMPDLESAAHYPGTCLFEGTNLSVGRGTDRPFQQLGAPWLAADSVVDRLNRRNLAGVRFEAVRFAPARPGDGKFDGVRLEGVRLVVTDRAVYDPTEAAVAALVEIRALHAGELQFRDAGFDRLAGTDRLRRDILDGHTVEEIVDGWSARLATFRELREPYLLYR